MCVGFPAKSCLLCLKSLVVIVVPSVIVWCRFVQWPNIVELLFFLSVLRCGGFCWWLLVISTDWHALLQKKRKTSLKKGDDVFHICHSTCKPRRFTRQFRFWEIQQACLAFSASRVWVYVYYKSNPFLKYSNFEMFLELKLTKKYMTIFFSKSSGG